ncbi:unnamed protein product, partial [Schistosoma turkestanicum]
LNEALIDYAASLRDFSEYAAHQTVCITQTENEVSETDDDIIIKNALSVYATIIRNVEEARRTMIVSYLGFF